MNFVFRFVAAGAKETVNLPMDFAGYTTFEEVTSEVCKNIEVGTEGRLKDTRDNKWYWVGKIKNNKGSITLCWMTQNLDYDGGGTYSTAFSSTDVDKNLAKYYSPGDYVDVTMPDNSSCNFATNNGLNNTCVNGRWVSVETLQPAWTVTNDEYFVHATSFVGTDGYSICNKKAGAMFGDGNYAQCKVYYIGYEHYSVGNYYNWLAATNGTGTTSLTSGEAGESICPAGWSLPTGGSNKSGSFDLLLDGITSSTGLQLRPYYLLYAGQAMDTIISIGGGYYSTSTPYGSNLMYAMTLTDSGIKPITNYYRYLGLSVRCVAR